MGDPSDDDGSLAVAIALRAADLLLELRRSSLTGLELRAAGDARSNALILEALAAHRPADAVLSEEALDDAARLDSDRVWIVDPLDGTREFGMPERTDWAVHVALWQRGREITSAAVALPALHTVHATTDGRPPSAQADRNGRPVILVSDSRPPEFAPAVADAVGGEIRPMGSAGAKAMAVYRGEADAYVHAGGQWEWDSAAPVGVLLAGGFHASRIDGSPLRYNQPRPYLPDLLICRPDLADRLLAALAAVEP